MLILKIIVLFEIVVITETGSAFAKKSNRDVYKDCGIHSAANGLVLGGKYVARGLWPWNVALFDIHPREYFCGGVLLSRRFVITAAHCLHAKHSIKRDHANILLVFGAYNLDFVKEPGTVSSYLNRSYIHPDWNTRTDNYDADIALIEVKNTITYSNFIKPVCLWTGDNLLDEVKGTVIGWGATSITKEASNEPFEITVPFVSYKNCLSDYPELGDVSSPRTFCGGARDGIQGPCYGDSGSGMFVKNKKRYYLRGLVSVSLSDNNKTCDTSVYALYTNIFMFTEWIRQTTEMTRTVPSNCSIDANYGYSCKVSAHIKRKSDKLNFSGAHMEGKTDNDVVYLKLDDSTINIIPTNIFEKFNNLTSLKMWNVGLTQINELSFTSCPNLIALGLQQNFLTKLPSRAFKELKQLIGLGVNSNPITEIETDAFEGLGNLKYLFIEFVNRARREVNNEECGVNEHVNRLSVGGEYVHEGLWPWKVALFRRNNETYFCGGVLISRTIVITAAHCLHTKHSDRILDADILLIFGAYNLTTLIEPGTISRYLMKSYIHPDWNIRTENYDADIALLELEKTIDYSNYIKPICLWTGDNTLVDKIEGIVVGWGATSSTKEEASKIPLQISVPVVTNEVCWKAVPKLTSISSHRTFCGGARDGVHIPCYGDSGSGMFVKNDTKYYVRGLVSVSSSDREGCDPTSYAVYTNIFMFTD
ncbi:unnamed protein product [Diamesa serratosioi]